MTLVWMLVEFGVSAYAAVTAHSPAMLAFGSDSLVELLSATVVLLQWVPGVAISERRASRAAGGVAVCARLCGRGDRGCGLALRLQPETSCSGMAITAAALVAMPVLAALKRREARRSGNRALAADAVQSATCAYIALITLSGLGDQRRIPYCVVRLARRAGVLPLLIKEGRAAWQGHACGCC